MRSLAPTLGSGAGADPKISGSGYRLGAGAAQSGSREPAPEPWQSLVRTNFLILRALSPKRSLKISALLA
uniref:Uncharacterized protein n=1 Tax=Bursaphelenchus xylophilus TaxID=6326 RepID=A0A1I7S6Q2_BURXY